MVVHVCAFHAATQHTKHKEAQHTKHKEDIVYHMGPKKTYCALSQTNTSSRKCYWIVLLKQNSDINVLVGD